MGILIEQWQEALDGMRFRHADREVTPVFSLGSGEHPSLHVSMRNIRDSVTDERMGSLSISSIELTYFPGLTVARRWLAAAFAGYLQHESLELVTLADGTRPIDPHGGNPDLDRGLRHGMPVKLTPETLLKTFEAVMPAAVAKEMAHAG